MKLLGYPGFLYASKRVKENYDVRTVSKTTIKNRMQLVLIIWSGHSYVDGMPEDKLSSQMVVLKILSHDQ
jgi:hypothetical protein